MMHIGYTGTRNGMTDAQKLGVSTVLHELNAEANRDGDRVACHHGDCIGGDEQFHALADAMGYALVGHPSTHNLRAFCKFHKEHEPKPPLLRNEDIVAIADTMIAAPAEMTEQERGGTWSTVRKARKAKKRMAIVLPDGRIDRERWTP